MKNNNIFFLIIIIIILYLIKINSNKIKENFIIKKPSTNIMDYKDEMKKEVIKKINEYRYNLLYQPNQQKKDLNLIDSIKYIGNFAEILQDKEKLYIKKLKVNKLILYNDDFKKDEYHFEIKKELKYFKNLNKKKSVHLASHCKQCQEKELLFCDNQNIHEISKIDFYNNYIIGNSINKLTKKSIWIGKILKGCDNFDKNTKLVKKKESNGVYAISNTIISGESFWSVNLNISKKSSYNGNIYISNNIKCNSIKNHSLNPKLSINNTEIIFKDKIKINNFESSKHDSTFLNSNNINTIVLYCKILKSIEIAMIVTEKTTTLFSDSILKKYNKVKSSTNSYNNLYLKQHFIVDSNSSNETTSSIPTTGTSSNPTTSSISTVDTEDIIDFIKIKNNNEEEQIYLIYNIDIKINSQLSIINKIDLCNNGAGINFINNETNEIYGKINKENNEFKVTSNKNGGVSALGLFHNTNKDKDLNYLRKKNKKISLILGL